VDARIKSSASHAGYDSTGDPSIGRITPAAADGTVWYTRPELHTIGRIACS
jgi:hypothetical protein